MQPSSSVGSHATNMTKGLGASAAIRDGRSECRHVRVEIRLLHVALGLEADGVAATHENRTDCREECTAVIATHAIKVSKHVALVAATVREDAHGKLVVLAIVSRISES